MASSMQSLLHLPMEAQPAPPPPPIPEPIPTGQAEALPSPPCFMELVKQQAERSLPSKACTPMLLQRANMLMQDVVEAACMCMRNTRQWSNADCTLPCADCNISQDAGPQGDPPKTRK